LSVCVIGVGRGRCGESYVRWCVAAGEIYRREAESVTGPARGSYTSNVPARIIGKENLATAGEHVPSNLIRGVVEEAVPPAQWI
jgi:hypothetical protein